MHNAAILLAEALLFFAVMAAVFRMRRRFGLGIFVCALGSMHFLETYLAAILYVEVVPGFAFSPGSAILFSGKLALLLLVYIYEDAATVRQAIYGLFVGNMLVIALVALLRLHAVTAAIPGQGPDFGFMNQMGGLMVWGTLLLLMDSILIILLFERSRSRFGSSLALRAWLCSAAVLTFDQLGFFLALRLYADASPVILLGGWVAKIAAAALYAGLIAAYARLVEPGWAWADSAAARLADVFDILTYRERYEDLLQRAGRDGLTGVGNRGRFETAGPRIVEAALRAGRPCSLLMVDLDNFKIVNDREGHLAGDGILRQVAQALASGVRSTDQVFRYGGDEFVVLCDGLPGGPAHDLAERLRTTIAAQGATSGVTASIGVATGPDQGGSLQDLIAAADRTLFQAKAGGRNTVRRGIAP